MARKTYIRAEFSFPKRFFGLCYGGRLGKQNLEDLLNRLHEDSVTEIMTHPGYYDAESMSRYDYWGYHWEYELAGMKAYTKRKLARQRNIKFVTFEEID